MAKKKSGLSKAQKALLITISVILIFSLVFYVAGDRDAARSILGLLFPFDNTSPSPSASLSPSPSVNTSDDCLYVRFIDVGQGDCIWIHFPDGADMLIDGGDNGSAVANGINTFLNAEGLDYFDYVMLTHTDSDHVGSMDAVVGAFEVRNFYIPHLAASYGQDDAANIDGTISTKVYYDFYTAAMSETYEDNGTIYNAAVHYNEGIYTISGEGYTMTVYCVAAAFYQTMNYNDSDAEDKNYVSPVCILEYAGRRVVFTGDSVVESEELFIQNSGNTVINCDVLKVGHHGSDSSTSEAFLNYIDPEYAVISVGADNTYGHPKSIVLDRLEDAGVTDANLYRTDEDGTVTLIIDESGNMGFTTAKEAA